MKTMYSKVNGVVVERNVSSNRVAMMLKCGWTLSAPKAEAPAPKKKKGK